MTQLYHYVGPVEIAAAVAAIPMGFAIRQLQDVMRWIKETEQHINRDGSIIATFTIDQHGTLHLADRHSEHVACAGGNPVLSAGEITFVINGEKLEVSAITNQSTGYCPQASSWPDVANALQLAGMAAPGHFSSSYEFRLCRLCQAINIIKDDVLECALCEAVLPEEWNF